MKFPALISILALFLLSSAQADVIKVSARLLDRGPFGAAIPGQFVYPVAELAAGESANLHIGELVDVPVWPDAEAESSTESVKAGAVLELKVDLADEGAVIYGGSFAVTEISSITESGATMATQKATFTGLVTSGEAIEVALQAERGAGESLLIHFEVLPE